MKKKLYVVSNLSKGIYFECSSIIEAKKLMIEHNAKITIMKLGNTGNWYVA